MTDYVKFKHSTPLPRKTKKFDGSRFQEYLYGTLGALDAEWADKIVDYNPDLKVDTGGFSKCVNRNMSMSTDCGFDVGSSLNSNDLDAYPAEAANAPSAPHSFARSGATLSLSVAPAKTNGFTAPLGYAELQSRYNALSAELASLQAEVESYAADAQAFRACKERLSAALPAPEPEADARKRLELLLDHMYTVMSEAFGPDNALVLSLEDFADAYVGHHNELDHELAALRARAELVESLEKLVADKAERDRVLEQRERTIDSLVEELKASKLAHASELAALRAQLEAATLDLAEKLAASEKARETLASENESLGHQLASARSDYKKLLSDQQQILSQLPLLALEPSAGPRAAAPKQHPEGAKPLSSFAQDWTASYAKLSADPKQAFLAPAAPAKAPETPAPALAAPAATPKALDNSKFLSSMVETLYRKNEELAATIAAKDSVIRSQTSKIRGLQSSLREWEADAVLWLDYVDQSSALLKGVK